MTANTNMLTQEAFLKLIENSESSILDFKREMYDLDNDSSTYHKTSKLIKDVISFINTIRAEPSYIIIGIGIENGTKEFIGLKKDIDESILQAKVKDKVFPTPVFHYYTIKHGAETFGVFEFPVHKYSIPLSASINMKGLKAGQPYYRQGSSNTEAIGHVLINISDWFRSLPDLGSQISQNSYMPQIAELLKKASNTQIKLSEILTETLIIAKKHNLNRLVDFCSNEIKGYYTSEQKVAVTMSEIDARFRIQKTMFSVGKLVNYNTSVDSSTIRAYLKSRDNYHEHGLFYNQSIFQIEAALEKTTKSFYATIDEKIKNIIPDFDGKDSDITFYIFHEDFNSLYIKIRQELLQKLIEV